MATTTWVRPMVANTLSDLRLYCLIQDDPAEWVSVKVPSDANVQTLKSVIQSAAQHGFLHAIDAKNLVVWMVRVKPVSHIGHETDLVFKA